MQKSSSLIILYLSYLVLISFISAMLILWLNVFLDPVLDPALDLPDFRAEGLGLRPVEWWLRPELTIDWKSTLGIL